MVSKADIQFIKKLKSEEPFKGYIEQSGDGQQCNVKFIGRGETAFYKQGDRALLFEVLAGRGVIFAYSIRRWDNRKKVTEEERETIIDVVTKVFKQKGFDKVEIVRK